MRRLYLLMFILSLAVSIRAQGPGPQPQPVVRVTTDITGASTCVAGKLYYNATSLVNWERNSAGVCAKITSGGAPGSVTSVSVVSANGQSGSVGTATTTPAITLNNPTALNATTSVQSPLINATTGFQIGGAATLTHYLRGNGTNYVDGAIQAGDVPTLNQNTSGTASNLSGTPALPNGTTATTQSASDNSGKLATTQYVDSAVGADTPPFVDTTSIVKGSADATKLLRFEVDGFTAGTTRVLTPPNFDGVIATLAGTEEFTNKTLNASVGKGTWTASGTWTLPAHTLNGTVSGGGNQINNVIIGTSTPLAGSFTTVVASTSTKTPIIFPASDSTTAIQVTKADGTTAVMKFDTTNARVGINKTPGAFDLDVNSTIHAGGAIQTDSIITATAGGIIGGTSAGVDLGFQNTGLTVPAGISIGWTASGTNQAAKVTRLFSVSTGIVGVGTSDDTTANGTLKAASVNATSNFQINAVVAYGGGTPGIAGNATLNTGSKDSAGKITSTGTGASTAVLTFSAAFTRAPACIVFNETTANLARPVSTTTTLTVNATVVTGDSISYVCFGY